MKRYYCYFKLKNENCPYGEIESDSFENALKICDTYFAEDTELDYICFWNVEVDYPFGWYYRDGKWEENEMIPEYYRDKDFFTFDDFEEYHKKRNWEKYKKED